MDAIDLISRRNRSHIKLEVANLAVEHVGRNPVRVVRVVVTVVSIPVDEGNTIEACGRLDGGEVSRISNEICVVLVNDWSRN